MIDVDSELLHTIIDDKELINKIEQFFKGCRVTFKKVRIEHNEILTHYKELEKGTLNKTEIVELLAKEHNRSKSQIWKILCKKK